MAAGPWGSLGSASHQLPKLGKVNPRPCGGGPGTQHEPNEHVVGSLLLLMVAVGP